MDINPGSIIQGPRWPEPIKVDLVEDLGEYVGLVGAPGIDIEEKLPDGRRLAAEIKSTSPYGQYGLGAHEHDPAR